MRRAPHGRSTPTVRASRGGGGEWPPDQSQSNRDRRLLNEWGRAALITAIVRANGKRCDARRSTNIAAQAAMVVPVRPSSLTASILAASVPL